jgi:hypothetical protein
MTDKRIRSEEHDDDGYWIILRSGYCASGGEHAIVENTRREAQRALELVTPCPCGECRPMPTRELTMTLELWAECTQGLTVIR